MSFRGRRRAREKGLRKLPNESKRDFAKVTGLKVGAKGARLTAAALVLAACGSPAKTRAVPSPERVMASTIPSAVPPSLSPGPSPSSPPSGAAARAGASPTSTSIEALILRIFGPQYGQRAVRVARCESNLNPRATGAEGERGLMQLHPVHKNLVRSMGYSWLQMREVEPNLRVAWALFRRDGWSPWRRCA